MIMSASRLLLSLKEITEGEEPNRILCTGHSLGAAVSTLGAHH
jgi:hypothetical protein